MTTLEDSIHLLESAISYLLAQGLFSVIETDLLEESVKTALTLKTVVNQQMKRKKAFGV